MIVVGLVTKMLRMPKARLYSANFTVYFVRKWFNIILSLKNERLLDRFPFITEAWHTLIPIHC